jgi:hypothetical protein
VGVAVVAAPAANAGKDALASDKADQLPIEDRYADDGSLTRQDQKAFSLRTGHTQAMKAVDTSAAAGKGMGERDLIAEMQSGRGKLIAIVVGGLVLLGGALFFLLR